MTASPHSRIDHLVVIAESLECGAEWCEATFGVVPALGGKHPFMGTHNRLLRIDSDAFPRVYLEIIAIDPDAPAPAHKRWFDMDDAALQQAVHAEPRLAHFVASTGDAPLAIRALADLGIDRGTLMAAERETPEGMLRWQISTRPDGQRLFYGGLPTIIQWSGTHPCAAMPKSDVTLLALEAHHPRPDALRATHTAIGLVGVDIESGAPNLVASLRTPKGVVRIESSGI